MKVVRLNAGKRDRNMRPNPWDRKAELPQGYSRVICQWHDTDEWEPDEELLQALSGVELLVYYGPAGCCSCHHEVRFECLDAMVGPYLGHLVDALTPRALDIVISVYPS